MKLIFASHTEILTRYRPVITQAAHFFKRINENDSYYFCSLFSAIEREAVLVNRWADNETFEYFLNKTRLKGAYKILISYADKYAWSELMNERVNLHKIHNIVFELQPIKLTVIHSLDFTNTEEFNREPGNMNASVNFWANSIKD